MRCSDGPVYSLNNHLVWCPKYRRPVLAGIVADRLKELLATKAREIDAEIHALQLMPDQVHLFVESHPERPPSHLAHQFKRFTSRMLRQEFAILVEDESVQPLSEADGAVGLDLGLYCLVAASNGRKVANPRHARQERNRLARAHRAVSRKAKGSRNREKARCRLGRLSARVGDRRRDALHQITTEIVRENQVVVIEDLPVKQMQASGGAHKRGLNRSMADAGWGELRRMLEYKCGWYGRQLVVVDRWFPSSKTCSACGLVLDGLPMEVRAWTCPGCGVAHDRDVNAATNVLAAGLAVLACGHGVSPLHTGGGRG